MVGFLLFGEIQYQEGQYKGLGGIELKKKTCVVYLLCLVLCLYFPFEAVAAGNAADGSDCDCGGAKLEHKHIRDFAVQEIFSPDDKMVDLSRTLKFDAYKASGTEEQRKNAEERLSYVKPAAFFLEGIRKVDKQLTLLVIGMMFCPDCTAVYPYVEAMEAANPLISVRYLTREGAPEVKKFMSSRTGRTNVPSIFVVRPSGENGDWDGKILNGAYVETPYYVTLRLNAANSNEERVGIWKNFHAGVYDEHIQRDLLYLILNSGN